MSDLLDAVTLSLWAVIGSLAVIVAWRFLGFRAALAALAAVLTMIGARSIRNEARRERERKEREYARKVIDDYRKRTREARARSEYELDRRNTRWMRR